jgi:predicted nucleotidyltransferase
MAAPALTELRRRRDEILKVAHSHGARRVRVFGPVARGDADTTSDIDFR